MRWQREGVVDVVVAGADEDGCGGGRGMNEGEGGLLSGGCVVCACVYVPALLKQRQVLP